MAWFAGSSAQAQLPTDFALSASNGGLPPSGGSATVTIGLSPGTSAIAAVGATLSFDPALVDTTACAVLVGLGACNTSVPGQINVQTVDPAGWSQDVDLFEITFTSVALTNEAPLVVEVIEAYDVGGTLIAGDVVDGALELSVRGDVNCSNTRNVADALFIAQFVVGNRTAITTCPLIDPTSQINTTNADMNRDGRINTLDALRVAQCTVGLFEDCDDQ